jgi:hypothetical protein
MALGRRLVVAPALWKGEAVVHARIRLDLTGHAGLCEEASQLFDHRQQRERVMLSAGDIEFTRHLTPGWGSRSRRVRSRG